MFSYCLRPKHRGVIRPKRYIFLQSLTASLSFLCVLQGGIYVLNVFDSQSGGLSLIFVVIFEAVAVSWGYGRYLIIMISQRCVGACFDAKNRV